MAKPNLFQQLTRLFRNGPTLSRKVRNVDTLVAVERQDGEGMRYLNRTNNPGNTAYVVGYPGAAPHERLARLQDFIEMDSLAEVSSALDIYADESVSSDLKGRSFHIYSNNPKIKKTLDDLFYNRMNVEFNLRPWVRNVCKNGDIFLFINVHMDEGVISVTPMPVHEIVREEAFDGIPTSVRFKWAGQQSKTLENWEVAHIRLMGSDSHFPYGTSILDNARRIWRQLIMCEDAMLVYRISRSPERRVFYIDVGNIPADEVANYMEQAKNNIVSAGVVDKANGRLDQRFAPLSILEDFYLPTRGGETGTRIDTLPSGNNTAAIEDVAYLQKKLIGALKVPAAYLGYSELLGSKSSLSAEDVRFSRTIQMIQKTVISELNKIAMIHLFSLGFREDDLTNFSLHLSNPSAIAQQQKLELFRTRFEIAGTVPEGFLSKRYIYKNILDMTDDEILNNKRELLEDATEGQAVEAAGLGAGGEEGAEGGEGDEAVGAEPTEEPGIETAGEFEREGQLLTSEDDYTDDEIDELESRPFIPKIDNKTKSSVKIAPGIKKYMHNRRRQIKRSQQHDPFRGFRTESLAEKLGYTSDEHLDEDTIQTKKQLDNAITVLPCLGFQELKELNTMKMRIGKKILDTSSDLLTEKLNINEDDSIVEIDNLDEVVLYDNLENELVKKFTNNG